MPCAGFLVESFDVAAFADFDGAIAEYFDEAAVRYHAAHSLAVGAVGGDEGGQHDHARFHEQLGDFPDTADVFDTVFGREAKVSAQAMTHVVAIQHEGAAAALVQRFFDGVRQRGFAGTGKSGEPEDGAAMAVLRFAARAGDGGVMPDNIG